MSIAAAVCQSEKGPVLPTRMEKGGQSSRELFPWEQGSVRDMWRGRIGTLSFGALLAWLVVLSNAQTIAVLEDEIQPFTSGYGLLSGRPAALSVQAIPLQSVPALPPRVIRPAAQPLAPAPARAQLGSYTSEDEAAAASQKMRQRYSVSLRGHKLIMADALVRKVQIYRVLVEFSSEHEARALCDAIKKQEGDCFVWAPPEKDKANHQS